MFKTRLVSLVTVLTLAALAPRAPLSASGSGRARAAWSASGGLLLHGTVVTMDARRGVLPHGHVLVRDGRIAAVWDGPGTPAGVDATGAVEIDYGPRALIFPGMINLHDHPAYDVLPTWTAPGSHIQADRGRPTGAEPYANRYQWNIVSQTSPAEYRRLVDNANLILTQPIALNLSAEVVKYAEIKALLSGTTAIQGAAPNPATDLILARNTDNVNFGRDRVDSRVPAMSSLTGAALQSVLTRMKNGQLDAWVVHLAEGVRDSDRRPGDPTSSRAEFDLLRSKGLLGDATVIVHGTGLEAADFAAMAAAPSLRTDGQGDGLGAKLVWSPHSNLLLYGRTTQVYDAVAAGVTVSLGTDWSPSGSPNLLAELKVADIALRDPRVLGPMRAQVPAFAADHDRGRDWIDAERALDRWLVETVTINPARTLRWDHEVGSVEPGKVADLLVITDPLVKRRHGVPDSPYRSLIDATESDVRLVLVDGEPLAGDAELMAALKPGDVETIGAPCTALSIDVTRDGVPRGTQTLAEIRSALSAGLAALGGDAPPAEGGPADDTNTYSYLKAHFTGTAAMSDAAFRTQVLVPFFGTVNGRVNLERMSPAPLIASADAWWLAVIGAEVDEAGAPVADAPPYRPYPSNVNQATVDGNPFDARAFARRWFDPSRGSCARR